MDLSAGGRKSAVRPTMNVTPLVDVVLVLLIIFMVVTPLLTKQFWLNLPKKDDKADQTPPPNDPEKPVVITVDAAGAIKVNQGAVTRAELKEKLPRILAARADQVVYFDAADDAPYDVAVDVMDTARRSGARSLAILTEKTGN